MLHKLTNFYIDYLHKYMYARFFFNQVVIIILMLSKA